MKPANDPQKISPDNIVAKLAFAVFGSESKIEADKSHSDEAAAQVADLTKILSFTLQAARKLDFDRDSNKNISAEVCDELPRTFTQFKRYIEDNRLPYENAKSSALRTAFLIIVQLLSDCFSSQVQFPYILEAKKYANFDCKEEVNEARQKVLHEIARELRKIENPHKGPVSFDASGNLIFKCRTQGFFKSGRALNRDVKDTLGKYYVYHRTFFDNCEEPVYLRERLFIHERLGSPYFRIMTTGMERGFGSVVEGGVVFLDNTIWLIGSANIPFKRLRICSFVIEDVHRVQRGGDFCTGDMMSNYYRSGEIGTASRTAVLIPENTDSIKNNRKFSPFTSREMSLEELTQELQPFKGSISSGIVD